MGYLSPCTYFQSKFVTRNGSTVETSGAGAGAGAGAQAAPCLENVVGEASTCASDVGMRMSNESMGRNSFAFMKLEARSLSWESMLFDEVCLSDVSQPLPHQPAA